MEKEVGWEIYWTDFKICTSPPLPTFIFLSFICCSGLSRLDSVEILRLGFVDLIPEYDLTIARLGVAAKVNTCVWRPLLCRSFKMHLTAHKLQIA